MSDYVKRKVIRLPFPKSLIEKLGVKLEKELKEVDELLEMMKKKRLPLSEFEPVIYNGQLAMEWKGKRNNAD